MRALVVYESMYGSTHEIADAVAEGLRVSGLDASAVPVGDAEPAEVAEADLLVVGGPTHVHGMTSQLSRKAAVDAAHKAEQDPEHADDALELDPDAEGPGLRDWFHHLDPHAGLHGAAFDTRIDRSPAMTGSAAKGIARRLRHHHVPLVADPTSFLMDEKGEHLLTGEVDRARAWGAALAERVEAPAGR